MPYHHLTIGERYVIYHLVLYGLSYREIGHRLKRHHTTISREVQRNRPTYAEDAAYWHESAQQYANQRKYQARHFPKRSIPGLLNYVRCKIQGAMIGTPFIYLYLHTRPFSDIHVKCPDKRESMPPVRSTLSS